jgi:hypothetical protein
MKPIEPATLISLFELGHISPMDLRIRLIQAAAMYPPERFSLLVPDEEVQAIRELAMCPPVSLEDTPRIFAIGTWVGLHDHEAEERQERRLWFEGIWRWHSFFQTGLAEEDTAPDHRS